MIVAMKAWVLLGCRCFLGVGIAATQTLTAGELPRFSRITTGPIVLNSTSSVAGSWADFDNDGDLDLYVTTLLDNNGPLTNAQLFRNDGALVFTVITMGPVVNTPAKTGGGAWADYNNDGNLDLFVTAGGNNLLFRNDGGGNFTRITSGDIVNEFGYWNGAAWGDYDRDGWVDLYVTRGATQMPNCLYHNNRDGTFTKVTGTPPVTDAETSYGCSWVDYDGDGAPDIFVANFDEDGGDPENPHATCSLYRNEGGGSFTKMTSAQVGTIVSDSRAWEGCAWADYDSDGDMDCYICNATGPDALYRNDGGTFMAVLSGGVGTDSKYAIMAGWSDVENDGDLDLFVTNYANQNDALYLNDGSGGFTAVTGTDPAIDGIYSMGVAFGDFTNDGYPDLFIGAHEMNGERPFYVNGGGSNHWLKVKLVGNASNKWGIGAKVDASATIGGSPRIQRRVIEAGNNYLSPSNLSADFGLGNSLTATVTVTWPSGCVQTVLNVGANQTILVTEPSPASNSAITFTGHTILPDKSMKLEVLGIPCRVHTIEASTDLVTFASIGAATADAAGLFSFIDSDAALLHRRYYRITQP